MKCISHAKRGCGWGTGRLIKYWFLMEVSSSPPSEHKRRLHSTAVQYYQTAKYICPNQNMYLSKLWNIFLMEVSSSPPPEHKRRLHHWTAVHQNAKHQRLSFCKKLGHILIDGGTIWELIFKGCFQFQWCQMHLIFIIIISNGMVG